MQQYDLLFPGLTSALIGRAAPPMHRISSSRGSAARATYTDLLVPSCYREYIEYTLHRDQHRTPLPRSTAVYME
jgi:hypothetical protein